ncbi:MAG: pepsin/retropepsin-like aspartic protease family protein [Gemmatimonadaceae bacterium]
MLLLSAAPGDHEYGKVVLDATLEGRDLPVAVDVGSNHSTLSAATASYLGLGVTQTRPESVTIGTGTARGVTFLTSGGFKAWGEERGILGADVLSQFDLVLDGPRNELDFYPRTEPVNAAGDRLPGWFPKGLKAADCVPMATTAGGGEKLALNLQLGGQAITARVEFGSIWSAMNPSAARASGLGPSSSFVQKFPGNAIWQVDGTMYLANWQALRGPVPVADRTLNVPVQIYSGPPGPPILTLALGTFRDRLTLISYSARKVCFGAPKAEQE